MIDKPVAIVNILSFSHEHIESLFSEGLWGFPDDKAGMNKRNWERLQLGSEILLYGEYRGVKGVWMLCSLLEKKESREPVKYWKQNPTGYPWQIKLLPVLPEGRFQRDKLEETVPIKKEELASLGLRIFRQKYDRWSLRVFGQVDSEQYSAVKEVIKMLQIRNEKIVVNRADHDKIKKMIYQLGEMQNRFPATEYQMDNERIDVIWKRTERSVPSFVFEVHISGNIYKTLVKLKHAFDLWNAIPVLVTTEDQISEAKRWIEGSFHEIKEVFRIVKWQDIAQVYESKQKVKEFERKLGII
jgi:hypothetical protein